MTPLVYVSGGAETAMSGWSGRLPLYLGDYAIGLDRPRCQLLGMLHEVNRATKRSIAQMERKQRLDASNKSQGVQGRVWVMQVGVGVVEVLSCWCKVGGQLRRGRCSSYVGD
jgi:hypothetical protein